MVCFIVKENTFKFFRSRQALFEIIRYEILMYLVIKQNLLMLAAKVEFMKMSTDEEKPQSVSSFIETKSDTQAHGNVRCKYGREPPAKSTI